MEKRKTKFKVECEIEVEYDIDENSYQTTPYTHIAGRCKKGEATLLIKEGKIINIKMKKLERIGENN